VESGGLKEPKAQATEKASTNAPAEFHLYDPLTGLVEPLERLPEDSLPKREICAAGRFGLSQARFRSVLAARSSRCLTIKGDERSNGIRRVAR
jgi:hypothetical protein